MSHWTRGLGVIKDLYLLERVAERMGVQVTREGEFESVWAGTAKCERTLKKDGGTAGVVRGNKKGEYYLQLDNYQNPICATIGQNGRELTHQYMVEKVREEAALMGGTIISEESVHDGSTEILINVA